MRRWLIAALLLASLVMPALHMQGLASIGWTDHLLEGTSDSLIGAGQLMLSVDAPAAPDYMGNFARAGSYLSPEHIYPRAIDAVVISGDVTVPAGAAVRIDVRGKMQGGNWQLWNPTQVGQRVAFDRPAEVVQFRLTLLAQDESPQARSVTVNAEWSSQTVSASSSAAPPTYGIHATREGLVGRTTANGHKITPRDRFVALPSWRSLSSRGGNEYQVRLTYKGRSVVVPVWDVGPWNTHDDYWSNNREMWKDLPRGLPEAQAAKLQGYNGGRDEFGRKPNLPNGIDIADGTFWDDLGMLEWDWVEVTFLWESDGGAAPPAAPAPTAVPAPPPPPAAPAPDGALVVDNSSAGFKEISGTWFNGSCGVGDSHRWTYSVNNPALAENIGKWQAPIAEAGFYEVFAYVPACGKLASKTASYIVNHDGGPTTVKLDQEGLQNSWNSLGTFFFKPGSGNDVVLGDITEEHWLSVRYDALAWVPRTDSDGPTAEFIDLSDLGAGRYLLTWRGNDQGAGVANFDIQVQRDGGEWTDWLVATAATEGTFLAVDATPSVYGFRIRARDWAGNTGSYPDKAQITTLPALVER